MPTNQNNDFIAKFSQLPEALQNACISTETVTTIQDALRLAQLSNNYCDNLMDLVGKVLILELPREKFKLKLEEDLGLSSVSSQIINKVIQDKIFEPLKNDLNQLAVNKPKLTFTPVQPATPIKEQKSESISKQEEIRPKKIEELIQRTRPIEEKLKEEIKKPPVPDLNLPEIQEIKIERPMSKTSELKRITVPSVSPAAQEKIHSKLMEAMKKKESKPKIVEEMKKVVTEGIKKITPQKTQPKIIPNDEKPIVSQVTGGENHKFAPQEKTEKSPTKKPYILDVKLKEEEEEKKKNLPKEEIKYQKSTEKPFGEA